MIQVLLSSFLYRNLSRVTELVGPGVGFQPTILAQEQLLFTKFHLFQTIISPKNLATAFFSPAS